jgi:hypothetical protein
MKASQFGAMILALFCLVPFTANAADIEAGKSKSAVCASKPIWSHDFGLILPGAIHRERG